MRPSIARGGHGATYERSLWCWTAGPLDFPLTVLQGYRIAWLQRYNVLGACGGAAAPVFSLGVLSQGLRTGDNQGSTPRIWSTTARTVGCHGVAGVLEREHKMFGRSSVSYIK